MSELLQQIPDMKDITEYWIIYPHKIQVPLHKDDLLYESKRNYSSALNLGEFEEKNKKIARLSLAIFVLKYFLSQNLKNYIETKRTNATNKL
jgi:hypothetical protein